MNWVLIGVLLYVALQLVVGVIVSRRIATEDDYLLAGRRLGYGLATFSFFATWFGAETCIGSAGKIYREVCVTYWVKFECVYLLSLVSAFAAYFAVSGLKPAQRPKDSASTGGGALEFKLQLVWID